MFSVVQQHQIKGTLLYNQPVVTFPPVHHFATSKYVSVPCDCVQAATLTLTFQKHTLVSMCDNLLQSLGSPHTTCTRLHGVLQWSNVHIVEFCHSVFALLCAGQSRDSNYDVHDNYRSEGVSHERTRLQDLSHVSASLQVSYKKPDTPLDTETTDLS